MEIFPIILIEFGIDKAIESFVLRIVYNSANHIIKHKGHKSKIHKLLNAKSHFIRANTNNNSYKENNTGKYPPGNKIMRNFHKIPLFWTG